MCDTLADCTLGGALADCFDSESTAEQSALQDCASGSPAGRGCSVVLETTGNFCGAVATDTVNDCWQVAIGPDHPTANAKAIAACAAQGPQCTQCSLFANLECTYQC